MSCPPPVTFSTVQALNLAATSHTSANQSSGGITLTCDANDFLVVWKPPVADSAGLLTWDAFSYWETDEEGGAGPWLNRFLVYGSNGGAEALIYDSNDYTSPDGFPTIEDALAGINAVLPVRLTGYTQYRVTCIVDSPLADNRAGLSLLAATGSAAAFGLDAPDITGGDELTASWAFFLKFETPAGDVRLADGGMLSYSSEVYTAEHSVFGAVHTPDTIETGFGDLAESAQIVLSPNGEADVADWWRGDLFDCRVRIWMGKLDSDGYTVTNPTLLADMLVDSYERRRGMGGEELLPLDLVSRAEKLFLVNEGNVCSERFHQTVWPGEKGFNNCTDLVGYVAWGAASEDSQ